MGRHQPSEDDKHVCGHVVSGGLQGWTCRRRSRYNKSLWYAFCGPTYGSLPWNLEQFITGFSPWPRLQPVKTLRELNECLGVALPSYIIVTTCAVTLSVE